jgi:hypothetical protein
MSVVEKLSANEKRRRSQWGAQLLVASELVRRVPGRFTAAGFFV